MASEHSSNFLAYQAGMHRALDEWPALSTVDAVRSDAATMPPPPAANNDNWIRWYVAGWFDTITLLREKDVEIYSKTLYGS